MHVSLEENRRIQNLREQEVINSHVKVDRPRCRHGQGEYATSPQHSNARSERCVLDKPSPDRRGRG
jgi:hypothetical protein